MGAWAERLLYLAVVLCVVAVVLRISGYHQEHGFLQGFLALETGLTPRAFLLGGGVCGVFSIAFGVVDISKRLADIQGQDKHPE